MTHRAIHRARRAPAENRVAGIRRQTPNLRYAGSTPGSRVLIMTLILIVTTSRAMAGVGDQGKTMQGKTMQGKTMQGKTMQGKTMQGKTMQGTANQTTITERPAGPTIEGPGFIMTLPAGSIVEIIAPAEEPESALSCRHPSHRQRIILHPGDLSRGHGSSPDAITTNANDAPNRSAGLHTHCRQNPPREIFPDNRHRFVIRTME